MQFRHFLITGLMVGAAIFVPHHAFAMNNVLGQQQHVQQGPLQGDISVKTNPVKQTIVPVTSEITEVVKRPVVKSQDLVQQQSTILQQDAVKKTASSLSNLQDQAKGHVQSAVKEAANKMNGFGSVQTSTVPKNSNLLNDKKATGNSAVSSIHIADIELKPKDRLAMPEPKGKVLSKSNKGSRMSGSPKNRQAPVSKGEIPQDSQVVNPSQRSNSSGGPSNDRDSHGLSSKNLMDKWLGSNKYNQLQHVRLYFSRRAFMKSQWVNAPPSPPPQKSSF